MSAGSCYKVIPAPPRGASTSRPFPIILSPPQIYTLPLTVPQSPAISTPPPTSRCGRGQWQSAPTPRISSAGSALLSRQSAPDGHLSPFHPPELPASLTLPARQHSPHPSHAHSHAFWPATCAFSEHSPLAPTPSSRLPHHAPDRPSPSLVISLTSPSSCRLSLAPSSHPQHIRVPLKKCVRAWERAAETARTAAAEASGALQ